MENIDILNKISAGMYILSTKDSGCVVDSVMQISSEDKPLVSVSVMKKNYTNEKIKIHGKFAISVIGQNINPNIIKTFGYNSSKALDKFEGIEYTQIGDIKIIKDSLGYMVFNVVDVIENETHTLFIGRLVESTVYSNNIPMTYQYFREHKNDLIKMESQSGKTAWVCTVCGYVYYGEILPEGFTCPICGVPTNMFKKKE